MKVRVSWGSQVPVTTDCAVEGEPQLSLTPTAGLGGLALVITVHAGDRSAVVQCTLEDAKAAARVLGNVALTAAAIASATARLKGDRA